MVVGRRSPNHDLDHAHAHAHGLHHQKVDIMYDPDHDHLVNVDVVQNECQVVKNVGLHPKVENDHHLVDVGVVYQEDVNDHLLGNVGLHLVEGQRSLVVDVKKKRQGLEAALEVASARHNTGL